MASVTVYSMSNTNVIMSAGTLHICSDEVNLVLNKREATELRDALNKGLEELNEQ